VTADPATGDDLWRKEILERMSRASEVLDRLESPEPYIVEPESDLARDGAQAQMWVDTIVTRRLKIAVDYLAGLRDLVFIGTHL
jgi:hypothetical protein